MEADGFLFGSPSCFGMMVAQFLAFFDATHELWASQASSCCETSWYILEHRFPWRRQGEYCINSITQLAHHGMLFVPLGYTTGNGMFEMGEVKGGSSYGAGTYAGDGSRQPTEIELRQWAFHQGYCHCFIDINS